MCVLTVTCIYYTTFARQMQLFSVTNMEIRVFLGYFGLIFGLVC